MSFYAVWKNMVMNRGVLNCMVLDRMGLNHRANFQFEFLK